MNGESPQRLPTVRVDAYSDRDPDPARQRLWGDYWIQQRLTNALAKKGFQATRQDPDVLIHLFGSPMSDLPAARLRILWIHSHPDELNPDLLQRYDRIFSVSRPFLKPLADMGRPDARWLMLPTHMQSLNRPHRYDAVFVGNLRRNGRRRLIDDLLRIKNRIGGPIGLWGSGLEKIVPPRWFGGSEIENGDLNELYAASKIVLNDHHEDMAREGFLNPRILDGLAAGALVISDPVRGMEELFDLPVYRTPDELAAQIETYSRDEERRCEQLARHRSRVAPFSYEGTASVLRDTIVRAGIPVPEQPAFPEAASGQPS